MMMADPVSGDSYLVTKRIDPAKMFRASAPHSLTAPITMEWVADLPFSGGQTTGGESAADGRMSRSRRDPEGGRVERSQVR